MFGKFIGCKDQPAIPICPYGIRKVNSPVNNANVCWKLLLWVNNLAYKIKS